MEVCLLDYLFWVKKLLEEANLEVESTVVSVLILSNF